MQDGGVFPWGILGDFSENLFMISNTCKKDLNVFLTHNFMIKDINLYYSLKTNPISECVKLKLRINTTLVTDFLHKCVYNDNTNIYILKYLLPNLNIN